jgi:hypothetical protein
VVEPVVAGTGSYSFAGPAERQAGLVTTEDERMTSYEGPQQNGSDGFYGAPDASAPYGGGQYAAPYGGQPPHHAAPGMSYGQQGYQPQPPPGAFPGPYGQPPYGYPYAPPRRTNGLAIASMVLGILWLYWIGSILALVFGYIARNQIRERGESGGGMATAGIVLGWIGVGFIGVGILIGIAANA